MAEIALFSAVDFVPFAETIAASGTARVSVEISSDPIEGVVRLSDLVFVPIASADFFHPATSAPVFECPISIRSMNQDE